MFISGYSGMGLWSQHRGGRGRQGFKDLQDEFEASLGYMSPHLKTNNNRFIVKHKPSLTKANYAQLFLLYFYSFIPCKNSYGFNQAQF